MAAANLIIHTCNEKNLGCVIEIITSLLKTVKDPQLLQKFLKKYL